MKHRNYINSQQREYWEWWEEKLSLQELEQGVRNPLYHYTNEIGLHGILRDEQLWFTDMRHLNDPGEIKYGLNIACDIIEEKAKTQEPLAKFCCKRIVDSLKGDLPKVVGNYVTSLSRNPDDLGQWRAYGDDGTGYALGLAPLLFEIKSEQNLAASQRTYVMDVIYGHDQASQLLEEPIARGLRGISSGNRHVFQTDGELRDYFVSWSTAFTIPLLWYALQVKHEAYQNEQETRLVITNDCDALSPYVETRLRGASTLPFIRSKFTVKAAGAINEIVVGPSAKVGAECDVRAMLASNGITNNIPIRRSSIPYRSRSS